MKHTNYARAEIEVTSEMIEAGLVVWADWDCCFEGNKHGVVKRIFLAMLTKSKLAVRVEPVDS